MMSTCLDCGVEMSDVEARLYETCWGCRRKSAVVRTIVDPGSESDGRSVVPASTWDNDSDDGIRRRGYYRKRRVMRVKPVEYREDLPGYQAARKVW